MKPAPTLLSLCLALGSPSAAFAMNALECDVDEVRASHDTTGGDLIQVIDTLRVPRSGVYRQEWLLGQKGLSDSLRLRVTLQDRHVEFTALYHRRLIAKASVIMNGDETDYREIEFAFPLPRGIFASQKLGYIRCMPSLMQD